MLTCVALVENHQVDQVEEWNAYILRLQGICHDPRVCPSMFRFFFARTHVRERDRDKPDGTCRPYSAARRRSFVVRSRAPGEHSRKCIEIRKRDGNSEKNEIKRRARRPRHLTDCKAKKEEELKTRILAGREKVAGCRLGTDSGPRA